MSETTKPEIKAEVIEFAKKLQAAGFKLDAKTGAPVGHEELFLATVLPEGMTKEHAEELNKNTTLFTAAAGMIIGDEGLPILKANKDLENIQVTIPTIANDTLSFNLQRSVQVTPPGSTEKQTKYGALAVKFDMYGVGKRGQLLKVKEKIQHEAEALFGG